MDARDVAARHPAMTLEAFISPESRGAARTEQGVAVFCTEGLAGHTYVVWYVSTNGAQVETTSGYYTDYYNHALRELLRRTNLL